MSLDEDPAITAYRRAEYEIVGKAERSVLALQQLQGLPVKIGEDMVVGYYRRISKKPMSLQEARLLARRDLSDLMVLLRGRIAPLLPSIGEVRAAALLHIGLVLNGGSGQKLDRMKDLWGALRIPDYEAAHDVVMLSDWPTLAGPDPAGRRRVLALARMLRTGEMPPDRSESA